MEKLEKPTSKKKYVSPTLEVIYVRTEVQVAVGSTTFEPGLNNESDIKHQWTDEEGYSNNYNI